MQVLALETRLDISGVGRGAGVGWYLGTATLLQASLDSLKP